MLTAFFIAKITVIFVLVLAPPPSPRKRLLPPSLEGNPETYYRRRSYYLEYFRGASRVVCCGSGHGGRCDTAARRQWLGRVRRGPGLYRPTIILDHEQQTTTTCHGFRGERMTISSRAGGDGHEQGVDLLNPRRAASCRRRVIDGDNKNNRPAEEK